MPIIWPEGESITSYAEDGDMEWGDHVSSIKLSFSRVWCCIMLLAISLALNILNQINYN